MYGKASVQLWANHFHIFEQNIFEKIVLPRASTSTSNETKFQGVVIPFRFRLQLLNKMAAQFQRSHRCAFGSGKSKLVTSKPEVLVFSLHTRKTRHEILPVMCISFRSSYPIDIRGMMYDQTVVHRKHKKMVTSKSELVDKIGTKYQRLKLWNFSTSSYPMRQ